MFGAPRRLFTPPKPEEKKVEAPAPTPSLTKEDLAAAIGGALGGLKTELETKIAELRGVVDGARTQPTVVVQERQAPVARPGVSDADIEDAIRTGENAATRIRSLVDAEVNKVREESRAALAEFQAVGLQSLAAVAGEVAASKMTHYKRFQKEIDERVARLEPQLRANPDAIRMIHDAVVGQHAAELLREAEETAVRRAQEGRGALGDTAPEQGRDTAPRGSGNTPGRTAAPGDTQSKVPSIQEIGGEDGMEALKFKDRGAKDADSFAQGMGYQSWAHYMEEFENAKREGEKMGIATS